jgi:hypothetical protein
MKYAFEFETDPGLTDDEVNQLEQELENTAYDIIQPDEEGRPRMYGIGLSVGEE